MAYFCRGSTRSDTSALCTPRAGSVPNHRVVFFLLLKRTTHKQFCTTTSSSFSSHTYLLAVVGHGGKLLHHVLELLPVSATEHQLAASCMESFGTFFGGSKEESEVDI